MEGISWGEGGNGPRRRGGLIKVLRGKKEADKSPERSGEGKNQSCRRQRGAGNKYAERPRRAIIDREISRIDFDHGQAIGTRAKPSEAGEEGLYKVL